jgi:hypothetical protein
MASNTGLIARKLGVSRRAQKFFRGQYLQMSYERNKTSTATDDPVIVNSRT